jgi:probable HAF family extracellular repeat protein
MRHITRTFVLCLAVNSVLFAADYRFTRIDFPGVTFTRATGINARGDIVGFYVDVNGATHGFLLRRGLFSTIDFPHASLTFARAINARGDIAGWFQFEDGIEQGFMLRDGRFTQIDFPHTISTTPRGINNAGDITGNYPNPNCGDCESGFILRDGVFNDVHIPGGFTSDIWSAQDNGQVMVGDAAMEPDFALHGFIRNKLGKFNLIDFPGLLAPCTGPRWINERGDIVGFFAYVNTVDDCYAPPPLHGFLLRQGKYTAIDVPGSTSTSALAINDDGEIVGWYVDKNGNTHGFEATPREGL